MATDWKLVCVNFSGVIYTIGVIACITILNLSVTCPAVCGEGNCGWPTAFAIWIVLELAVNLILFHYFNRRNKVSWNINYWRVKSSSLLQRNSSSSSAASRRTFTALNIDQSMDGDESRWTMSTGIDSPPLPIVVEGTENGGMGRRPSDYHSRSPSSSLLVPTLEGRYLSLTAANSAAPSTRFCVDCGVNTSRRSHHCPLCGICILRKDHHCFLTGGCVGLANQRFFIVFLFWASVGTAYGVYFNFTYLDKFVVAEWLPFNWMLYMGPIAMIRWMLGMEQFFHMVLVVVLTISVASFLGAFGFLCAQIFYTLNGYTMHDYHVGRFKERIESDGDTFAERLALVFGRRWWLNFLVPQFWLPNEMTPAMARNIFISECKDM